MPGFQLKEYQRKALDALSAYYRACMSLPDANTAFYAITKRPYHPVKELPGLPYVCLRLPTGAGKTFVACHAIHRTIREYLQSDYGMVLWLVPSNAIREQTLKALKDRFHPYRHTLDSALGSVTVMDISDALYLSRPTLDTSTVIIVSTIQAFRVDDTEGRKVYEVSGSLMEHFSGYHPTVLAGLETVEGSTTPKYSLANVLRLHRPVVIVDEAHNARTSLTFDVLARFNPACILELTATPDTKKSPSNVLYQVSAAELKAEDMIKLPIVLQTHVDWRELLSDAIAKLDELEDLAHAEEAQTGEYIRPIMLLQAQPKRKKQDTLTIDVVRQTLIQDFNISEKQIIRHGQGYKELDDVDILQPDSPVRFVITVSALKEGWDCPFAYVLCSVADVRSSTAVEQILGRIMRLPHARRKQNDALNRAYAFAASAHFLQVAETLKDGLVQNGFERLEAEKLVEVCQPGLGLDTLPLLSSQPQTVTIDAPETLALETLPPQTADKVTLRRDGTLVFTGFMTEADRDALRNAFQTDAGKKAVERAFRKNQALHDTRSPAERGEKFSVPVLAFKQGNLLEQFEQTHILEHPWRLSQQDARLTEEEYPSQITKPRRLEIDITDNNLLGIKFVDAVHQQMRLLASDQGWAITHLVAWLDHTIPHPDIVFDESSPFILKAVQMLINQRGLSLKQLIHDKYRLRQAIAAKIEKHRRRQQAQAYQKLLFGDDSPVTVTPDLVFTFDPHRYPCKPYQGPYKFQNHYYPEVGDFDSAEERTCAAYLDSLEQVEFWVRNPDRSTKAFWLQTATDRFYPDFVCKLTDGRFLVVEYKGSHLWSNEDSTEKRILGELWEKRSHGQCLFVMPRGNDCAAIDAKLADTTNPK